MLNVANGCCFNNADEGKKVAYFEPKSAKPDHPLVANVQPANVNSAKKLELNVPHAEQVAPPRVDDADDQNQQRVCMKHLLLF